MKVKDIEGCEVIFGKPSRRLEKQTDDAQAKPYPSLRTTAINDGFIDMDSVETREFFTEPPQESFTRKDDIVLKLSAPFSAAVVGPEATGLFIPSSCAVIRLSEQGRKRFSPAYIAGFLNLPLIADSLRAQANGSKVLVLNRMQIDDIDVPEAPIDEQGRVAALFEAQIRRRKLRRQIEQVESQMVEAAYSKVMGEAR